MKPKGIPNMQGDTRKEAQEPPVAASLRANVNWLGSILGEAIVESDGEERLEQIERIRALAKSSRGGEEVDYSELIAYLRSLPDEDLVPVARAFHHFLNLVNIADQHHVISREMDERLSATHTLKAAFEELMAGGCPAEEIRDNLERLHIELVLTAHPTEITRRSLISKHLEIARVLSRLELKGHADDEREALQTRLREMVVQIWHTDDFRGERPTPVDEARWGFAVVENSLWDAVPEFMRRLRKTTTRVLGHELGPECAPLRFAFWMGGDRDGNPNVTHQITREVLLLARWKAIDLYQRDLQTLSEELSMKACSPELAALAAGEREPYRRVLRDARTMLHRSLGQVDALLDGNGTDEIDIEFDSAARLLEPLLACHRSLVLCGMEKIADGKLLDTIYRVRSFGCHLVRFDVRQESGRHESALAEITNTLGLGDYAAWDEEQRRAFLLAELASRRPLLPERWQPSPDTAEVLATCREIARHPRAAFGAYVISMARQASDVLAVQLLMKACGVPELLGVAPLFETLDDLNRAPKVLEDLLAEPTYRQSIDNRQMVMIGYSDSAKDAGVLAAGWAQYQAQEQLLEVAERHGVSLQLFHGRGGTIGRGGAPAHAALISQPPGSLKEGLRVTEQGETIRAKLGMSLIATQTLALYTSAILRANTNQPPVPKGEWRALMDRMGQSSCDRYRTVVRDHEDFVTYFRQVTPEQELAKLPLGSRPSRRRAGGGIETLRAIPWIFAWSQTRLMLPAWLGACPALRDELDAGNGELITTICNDWPFFATRISMLDMVFAKTDAGIARFYDETLVEPGLKPLGDALREQLAADHQTLTQVREAAGLESEEDHNRASVRFRNTYIDPLNLLQAELLRRNREQENPLFEQAIMVSIAGIAAGLRNTG